MSASIKLSGLRLEDRPDGLTYLVSDIDFIGFDSTYDEREMWFSVENEDSNMFETRSCDAFFLVPLYLAMFHGATLRIEGNVSRTLYRNMMDYGQQILCDFSPALERVSVEIVGYENLGLSNDRLVGAGISCGVDSLSTIYDRFVKEEDRDCKVSSLFLFNCGTHGDFEDEQSCRIFNDRFDRNSVAARELGLPIHAVNSNLHAFTHKIGEQKLGFFAIYSCALSVQHAVKRYYVSSACEYGELLEFGKRYRDFDMAGYCEAYLVPLIKTECFDLVLDGAQRKRSGKVANISGWNIAKRHMDVCVNPPVGMRNCSVCSKCKRTLIALEAMGLLDEYSGVFDIPKYRKVARAYKLEIVFRYGKEGFATDNVDFAREKGLALPGRPAAMAFGVVMSAKAAGKKALKRIFGERRMKALKRRLVG